MQSVLEVKKANRIFGSGDGAVHALQDIDITIQAGKLTVLRGRSGSGKTCLINLLGALDKPTSGQVFYDQNDITSLSEMARDTLRRKNYGFVFQSVALISAMTAMENVDFALRLAGYPSKEREQRAKECLAFVGLQGRMGHRPHELSGGEQQRVAIARAIAHKPKVLFADEPTAELDSRMSLQIMLTLRQLIEREGATIVMTTHDPLMMELCDEAYTLQDGVVIHHEYLEVPSVSLSQEGRDRG